MRRLYGAVAVEPEPGGFGIRLDRKPVRTPAGQNLLLPGRALADAIAEEWRGQGGRVDPATMPMLQLANSALDRVASDPARIVDQLVAYAETDLLCHWASDPPELVARQHQCWQPLLDWAAVELDAALKPVAGVMAHRQPGAAIAELRAAVAALDPFRLAALYILTTGTGSLLIGLAVVRGRLDLEAAWQACQVDEAYQAEKWGEDSEAVARRVSLKADLAAAQRFLSLLPASA
jgi:chaperone required for assembly of F1-ATPase